MKTAPISERDFHGLVVSFATLTGWTVYHTLDSRGSTAGFPDLVLCRPPDLVFAELKTDIGKVSPSQQAWIDGLAACGVEAVVWRPSDWTSIEARLRKPSAQ